MPNSKRKVNSAIPATNYENMTHFPGSIIDNRYQIIQKLGRSDAGKTYLAKDLQATMNARCVVEQLSVQCDHDANWRIFQQHLLNEVAVLERLGDHPQIPQLYHHLAADQEFYLIREYIDGDSLEQEVESKIFDEGDTIQLIQDVLRILDFIHKTNVIHRDVQPAHIIRRKQDQVFTLVHFGAIREIESTEINLKGELIFNRPYGNWSYIAPEQKEGESKFCSDIYALGRTAIYALTGKSPQELEQTNREWQQQCQISPKLEAILRKMMSLEIEQRYSSAIEVLYDLRPLLKLRQIVGGRYSITHYLGGSVKIETYLANNLRRQYQSPCVVKQIELPHGDGDIKLEKRFAEELSVLERLGYHEQIPQVWDHFEEDEQFYLVQEYFQGENLAQKIAKQNLSTSQIIQVLISTLSVLSFIHQNRIIHRNIKPSNLIVNEEDERVILTDFGILNDIKTLPNQTLEHGDDRDNYWSPEQIAGRPTISSDLYALGMTAIEALTRVKPITFPRNPQTGKLLWTEDINLDRRLIKIVDKMIELDLGQRYQSAGKVAQDLQKIGVIVDEDFKQPPKQVRKNVARSFKGRLAGLPILIGLLGVACLFGSIEFAFPIVRPSYYWYQGQKLLPEQPQNALDTFTKAIDLKPQSVLAWSGRGDALSLLQRYPQALEAYAEAINLNANIVENWLKQGNILYRLERYTDAIAAYDSALALERENGEIYHRRGKALARLQQYQAALTMQEAALELERFNAQYLSARAQNLLELGRYYDALSTFNRVQAIEPDSLPLWQNKYLVLKALNRPQEAARVFREVNNDYLKVLQQEPQNEQFWLNQGDFFTTAQMYPKAIDSYSEAIKLKPNMYQAWLAQGKVLAQLEQNQQALASLDKALQIRPESYIALQAQGLVHQNQNNFTEAIALYEQGLEINPNYAPLWRDRGLAFNQQQNYSQAIASLSKASSLAGYDAKTWQGLAEAWSANDQEQKALSAIDRALEINPSEPELWSIKGLIYTKNAQYNEACNTYRESRRSVPNSSIITNSMMRLGCRMN
ncbi:MAG: tetratricopeptide repeat protein [Cyanobacteria bacterium P01_A01_bin.40]